MDPTPGDSIHDLRFFSLLNLIHPQPDPTLPLDVPLVDPWRREHVECCLSLMTSNALMHLGWTKKRGVDVCVFFLESCWITIWIGHLFDLVGVEC